jgi:hypothetical protein
MEVPRSPLSGFGRGRHFINVEGARPFTSNPNVVHGLESRIAPRLAGDLRFTDEPFAAAAGRFRLSSRLIADLAPKLSRRGSADFSPILTPRS